MGSGPLRLNGDDGKAIGQVTTVTLSAAFVTLVARYLWPELLAEEPEIMAAAVSVVAVAIEAVRRLVRDTRTDRQRAADRVAAGLSLVAALKVGLTRAESRLEELQKEFGEVSQDAA